MKKIKLIKKILIVLIAILVVILLWKFFTNSDKTQMKNDVPFVDTKILGDTKDLVSFSVDPGKTVTGVLNVVGSLKGGYFFEANILVNILDSNKKLLRAGHGNAKSDWTTNDPVGFDAALDFTKLPKGPAYIEIHNDNASGLPQYDKSILIPVIIK
jgi:hypothetical protein